jgi:hypothetical protein
MKNRGDSWGTAQPLRAEVLIMMTRKEGKRKHPLTGGPTAGHWLSKQTRVIGGMDAT